MKMVIIITQKRNHKKTIHRKVIENSEFKNITDLLQA